MGGLNGNVATLTWEGEMSEVGSIQGENVLHLLVTGDGGVIKFARQQPTRYDCTSVGEINWR